MALYAAHRPRRRVGDRHEPDRDRAAAPVLKSRGHRLGEKGYAAAAAGWGILVGGTTGAGVILLSLLMATGLEGTAVIATDASVSIVMGIIKVSVFALAGVFTPTVLLIGLLIGGIGFPATFIAKLIVERLPVHVHTFMLDAVVIVGGSVMIYGALKSVIARSEATSNPERRRSLDCFASLAMTIKATSPPAAATTGSTRHCRRCAGRRWCRGRRAD